MATLNYCNSDCTNGPWTVDSCDNVFVVAGSSNRCESYQTWVEGPNTNQRKPCKRSATITKNADLQPALLQFEFPLQQQIPQTYGVHIWGAKSYCKPVDPSDGTSKCFMDDVSSIGCSTRVTGNCTYENKEVDGLKNGRFSYYEIAKQIRALAYDDNYSYAESSVGAAGITQAVYDGCDALNTLSEKQACLFNSAELQKDSFMDVTKYVCPPSTKLDTTVCRESLRGCVYEDQCMWQVRAACFDPQSPYDIKSNHAGLESCNYSALYCQDFSGGTDPDLIELHNHWPKKPKAFLALATTYPHIDQSPNMQHMWFERGLDATNYRNNQNLCSQIDGCRPMTEQNTYKCINENDTKADIYSCTDNPAAPPCEIDCSRYTPGFPGVCIDSASQCDGSTEAECDEKSHCTFANQQCVAKEYNLIDNIAPGNAFAPHLSVTLLNSGALTSTGLAEPKTMIAVLPADQKKNGFSMLWLLLIIPCGVLALVIAYKVINRMVKKL